MRKSTFLLSVLGLTLSFTSCKTSHPTVNVTQPQTSYWEMVNQDTLAKHLKVITADDFEGRRTGEKGQKKATDYIVNYYKQRNISFPNQADSYTQVVPASFMSKAQMKLKDSENIWAFIEGSEKPDEVLVITAHYDHLGILMGQIYNGADDNGSGTVAVMELARLFKSLANEGIKPKRSVLFLHVTGEEFGLYGSRYYVENPIIPLKNTIANINIDMIGRKGKEYKGDSDYVYVVGADKLSLELNEMSEQANKESVNLDLDYAYNAEDHPEQIYYRSDHYSFAKHKVPAMFYFNGTHEDYHLPGDTFDKIDMHLLTQRTKLAFATAWKILNAPERPKLIKP
ncbi:MULTISPECIES: M28 family metallopeptidase [unclassified Myroides]|uniref:M28 family metallopeptidase n=1 Tax=unclassified Myroides TaxID=2642485 RepID=UPI003101860D